MHTIVLVFRTYGNHGPVNQLPAWMAIPTILIIFGLPILWFWNKRRREKKWETGVWPIKFPFNRGNLMEAYIGAAAILVRKDRERMHGKLPFINSYLQREFRNEYYDFKDSYMHSLKHPVSVESLAEWLNRHIGPAEKERLIWFLLHLAASDGFLNDEEYGLVHKLARQLELDWDQFEKKFRPEEKRASWHSGAESAREKNLRLLGLDTSASEEAIRSAYRSLVKIYHPDRFANESADAQQQATAKFREIREAYEQLTT